MYFKKLCENLTKLIQGMRHLDEVIIQLTPATIVSRPFVRDYPGEPVPEEAFTNPPS